MGRDSARLPRQVHLLLFSSAAADLLTRRGLHVAPHSVPAESIFQRFSCGLKGPLRHGWGSLKLLLPHLESLVNT